MVTVRPRYTRLRKAELGLGLHGLGLFGVPCEAHSHLHSECEAHSHGEVMSPCVLPVTVYSPYCVQAPMFLE